MSFSRRARSPPSERAPRRIAAEQVDDPLQRETQSLLAPNWSFHVELLLLGWGLFNIVEGLIDHQILNVHHVRDDLGGPLSWDTGFLTLGVLSFGAGWLLYRRGANALELYRQDTA
jgi:hypothetical protein